MIAKQRKDVVENQGHDHQHAYFETVRKMFLRSGMIYAVRARLFKYHVMLERG